MFSEYCDKTFTVIGQWSDKLGINSSTWKLTILDKNEELHMQ